MGSIRFVLLGIFVFAASAAHAAHQPDIMIRGAGGTLYKGDGITYTTRINQTQILATRVDVKAVFEIRVRNNGDSADILIVTGAAGGADWTITYFDSVGTDITEEVTGDGWSTSGLAPGGYVDLRLEVVLGPLVYDGDIEHIYILAVSQTDNTKTDMVKALTRAVPGATYYVSTSGSNSNPGTRDYPWATPGYASRQLHAGDTLIILGGRYVIRTFDDDIMVPPSGAPGEWITIRGDLANRPVIAGRDNLYSAVILDAVNCLRLQNIEITHDSTVPAPQLDFREGVTIVSRPCANLVLQNLYIHHIDEMAVDMKDVENVQIVDCRFEYCGFGGIGGPAGEHGGCRNILVDGCELSWSGHYYQGGDGHDRPYDRPDGFGVEPSDGPIEIRDTTAQHNYGDGLDSKCANTYIHECIVANNSCDGIKFWSNNSKMVNCLIYGTGDGVGGASPWAGIVIDDADTPNAHFEIINCTLQDNPTRQAYPMYVQYGLANPISLLMRNTIIANGYGLVFIGDSVSLTFDHNLIYRPAGGSLIYANSRDYTASELGLLGQGNLAAQPWFVQPAWGTTGDYHLLPGSPGIGAGSHIGAPSIDLDHRPRPQDAAVDMGAYQR